MWGLAVMAVGTAFLLERNELFDISDLWHYWPLLLVLGGINQMIGYPSAKHFCDGLWSVLVGLWLFACFEHLYGMTFRGTWPFLVIALGVTMVLKPLMAASHSQKPEYSDEK